MPLSRNLLAAVAALAASAAIAGDTVGVNGSTVQYPVEVTAKIGAKEYPQKLSGTAMRKKLLMDVYTIGSYVSADFKGKTADELACCDMAKQLHLVLERNVAGADMAKAFETAIRANYPTEFNDELAKLTAMMRAFDVAKGDHVWITHVPGYGLHIELRGKKSEFIPGLKFAKAVWEIYLGQKNVGEAVKKGLLSRL